MKKLDTIKTKEKFLSSIESVEKEQVFEAIQNNTEDLDLYTYFITMGAHNTGSIDENELYDYMLKVYSDWYFLTKNTGKANVLTVKLFSDENMSPAKMTGKQCFELFNSKKYDNIIPIEIRHVNKLDEKFFVNIDVNALYQKNDKYDTNCRLYINLPANKIIGFVKEFTDRAYLENMPCNIKFLSCDDRCDTVIIYTDYDNVENIVHEIENIKKEYPTIMKGVGGVNVLLGKYNDYIGFGERPDDGGTYFHSRARALESIKSVASLDIVKENFVGKENKIIFRSDGKNYTPTEYLTFLIEKMATKLVEEKIETLEKAKAESEQKADTKQTEENKEEKTDTTEDTQDNKKDNKTKTEETTVDVESEEEPKEKDELARLYEIRENIQSELNLDEQVKALKKSLTTRSEYRMDLGDLGQVDYNFLGKLYSIFTVSSGAKYGKSVEEQKRVVASKIFRTTDTVCGVNTRDFLCVYFRQVLTDFLKEILDRDMESCKQTKQSSMLNNLKTKKAQKLKLIISKILDEDDDEGKEYISDCINDYIRILSTDASDNVEVYVDDEKVVLDTDINADMLYNFPDLQTEYMNLSKSNEFIDKTLQDFGIQPENLALSSGTKNVSKTRVKDVEETRTYYYDPEGYLGK